MWVLGLSGGGRGQLDKGVGNFFNPAVFFLSSPQSIEDAVAHHKNHSVSMVNHCSRQL